MESSLLCASISRGRRKESASYKTPGIKFDFNIVPDVSRGPLSLAF